MNGGDIVLIARRRARLTQRQLAERIGCRQATIARWERGDRLPSYEDVQGAVTACGLQLDVLVAREDRSWWPQIAAQLDRAPDQRVRGLTPPGVFDAVPFLEALAETCAPAIVLGELAGALHGWPLVLGGTVEVCARSAASAMDVALGYSGARRVADGLYELSGSGKLILTSVPPGTSGFGDLAHGATQVAIDGGTVQVACLLDLVRIADASADPDARRHALAYRAVLDVERARRDALSGNDLSDDERIEAWLSQQTPVA